MCCEEELWALGFSGPGERKAGGDLIAPFSILKRENNSSFIIRRSSRRLSKERFILDMRTNLFNERVDWHWNSLSRGAVDALCLSVFKTHVDNTLNGMFYFLVSPKSI